MRHKPDSAAKGDYGRSFIQRRHFPDEYRLTRGAQRTEVWLKAYWLGPDLLVHIGNAQAHLGAVAVGEYDEEHQRTSVSVITRLGHKDDIVARRAANRLASSLRIPVCVLAGIHLPEASRKEIVQLVRNAGLAVTSLIRSLNTVRS